MIDISDGVPGVNAAEPTSFEEFWPYYLSQHLHPATRAVHVAGTIAAWSVGITCAVRRRPLGVLGAPLLAYGPAFASHFIFEKNRPATLGGHALWSIGGDMRMLARVLTGKIGDDVAAIRQALDMEPHQITIADLTRDRGVERSLEIPGAPLRDPVAAGATA